MNLQMVIDDIKSLPVNKQEEVADFIAYLKSRFGVRKSNAAAINTAEKSDGFVGMWQDRAEMDDRSAWVRDLRSSEWERGNV